jgi:hypothetical protein
MLAKKKDIAFPGDRNRSGQMRATASKATRP